MGKFWADGHEITLNFPVDRASRFDRDDMPACSKDSAQLDAALEEHGFTPGKDDVAKTADPRCDLPKC